MKSVFRELASGMDIVPPHRESHILWMGPGTSIDVVTRKEISLAVKNQLLPSGALIVTSLNEILRLTKYVFVTDFSLSLSLSLSLTRKMKGQD